MQALNIEAGHQVTLDAFEAREPGPDEVQVEVMRCGVCGSDAHQYREMLPSFRRPRKGVLGHEVWSRVSAVGDRIAKDLLGRWAIPEVFTGCCACPPCEAGFPMHCDKKETLGLQRDGGMAPYLTVPGNSIIVVEEALTPECGAFVEVLSVAHYADFMAETKPDEDVLVIGPGPIGYATAAVAKEKGANVSLVGIQCDLGKRLKIAAETLGIETLFWNPDRDLLDATSKRRFPRIIDCSGSPLVHRHLQHVTMWPQRVVFVGMYDHNPRIEDYNACMRTCDIRHLYGSRREDYLAGINTVQAHPEWFPDELFDIVPLRDAADTFLRWIDNPGEFNKLMIDCEVT